MSPLFAPLIVVHAVAGLAALVLAVAVMIRPAGLRHPLVRSLWTVLVTVVVAFLVGAVAVGWPSMDLPRRLIDAGLVALGVYMLVRAVQAAVTTRRGGPGWAGRMTEHVGFVAISLFDGFVIVSAIRAGMPIWVVVAIGVAGVGVGIGAVNALKRRPGVAAP